MLLSSSECITWFAVLFTASVAIVTVNLLSIILFIKNPSLCTRAMYLVINLTVADMFVGGFSYFSLFGYLSYSTCDIVKMPHLGQELTLIIIFLHFWLPLTSLTNIAAISLDQMHATIRPFWHRRIEKWVYGVTIAGVWVLAAMVAAARLITIILRNVIKWITYGFYIWTSYCCLCLFVICVSYSSIAVKFLCGAHPQHHGAANRQKKLTVTLFIMTITSLLMWLPYAVYIFLPFSITNFLSLQEREHLLCSLTILYLMNSLVNPIVYIIRIREFRKALLLLFKRQRRQNARDIPLHAL